MKRIGVVAFSVAVLMALSLAANGQALQRFAKALLQLYGTPVAASSGIISEHEMAEINAMGPQDQVERLLERAINHYQGAAEEIAKRADGWTGKIESSSKLNTMTSTAYFASDLRVRAIALEIWLAEYNIHKAPEAVDELTRALASSTDK